MVLIDKNETGWIPKLGLYLFPALTVIFIGLYIANENLYRYIIGEDSVVEWLTFICLISTGILSLIVASGIRKKHQYIHWFFVLFLGFNLLAGMEEISWGQRVFDVQTTGVFREYSDQNEMNLHNTFQGIFHIKTKHIALLVLFVYGSLLPGIMRKTKFQKDNLMIRQFITPPMFLRGGFTIAAILMLDFQTGHEEEIGEFFFSVCFLVMMIWNLTLLKRGHFRPDSYRGLTKRIPSLSK